MKATTVKLEGELLERLEAAKPPARSLSAHVRSVLQKDLERRQARTAAATFNAFVDAHPPGIRQVSKARMAAFIGVASSPFMDRLDSALALYLGD